MDEELIKQIEEFNKSSQCKIQLIIEQPEKYEPVGNSSEYTCIIPRSEFKFIFKIIDVQNTEYTISTYDLANEAFELSKLICKRENAKLKIDFLIKDNCKVVIKCHNQQSEIWDNYLKNWKNNSLSSEYKTLEEAMHAREIFSNNLQDKIIKHLKQYELETFAEIKQYKQHTKELTKSINALIKDTHLRIDKTITATFTKNHLYDLAI